MSDRSAIEWTDATWSPVTGCTRVSEGCDHCYIERTPPFRIGGRRFDGVGPGSTTGVVLHPERLDAPLRWRKPRRVFVNSLSDLFHDDVPSELLAEAFAVMALAERHQFQILTKRPARMRSLLNNDAFLDDVDTARLRRDPLSFRVSDWPRPNIWLGVSVESQRWADVRIPTLLKTPAAVRFLSCEPLLGPVDILNWTGCPGDWCVGGLTPNGACPVCEGGQRNIPVIDWLIVGGESGPGARPMHPDWARQLRDQCHAADVPFFVKQMGSGWSREQRPLYPRDEWPDPKGGDPIYWPEDLRIREFPDAAG